MNRRRVVPVLSAAVDRTGDLPGEADNAARLLRRTVRTEVALVAAVLAVTGALVGYSPSSSSSAGAAGPAVVPTGPGGTVGFAASAGPARLRGTYDPARKVLRVRVLGADVQEVRAAAELPTQTLGAITTAMTGRGEVFTARSVELVPPGDWRVKITVRVSEFDEYSAVVTIPVTG